MNAFCADKTRTMKLILVLFIAHSCPTSTHSIARKNASALRASPSTNLPDRDQTPYQTWLDTALPANICS